MAERDESDIGHGRVDAALADIGPDSVDGQLIRSRVMARMFERDSPPPRFGRFELRERIGQGGMGVVYRAWDPQLERLVAIKLVETRGVGSSLRQRAATEARSLAKLAHPNVVTVFETGIEQQRVWIAIELVPGTTMQDWLTQDPRPHDEAILHHWIAAGRGLQAAHDAGLVHRDIKPSNVLIGDDGRARVIDFGLVQGDSTEPDEEAEGFVGTHRYAAPEQRHDAGVDAAADQYAWCVSLWESLCGQLPPKVDPGRNLPDEVRRILLRGVSEDPKERFPSVGELLAELEAAVAPRPARWRSLLGMAGFAAVVAGVAVPALQTEDEAIAPCAFEDDALAGTWDDERRQSLRELLADQVAVASIERGLDDWATGWHEARRVSCVAARVDGIESERTLDLRRECLEQRRRVVQITLDTLSTPTFAPQLATHGPELLARLPDLSACADGQRLSEGDPLPEPGPEREAISAGYDRLAEARALATTGALERAQSVVAEVDPTPYAPLNLELKAFPAQLEIQRGRVDEGVPRLIELARDAEARQLDELAARLWVEAAAASAARWSSPRLERFVVEQAQTVVRRLGRPNEPLLAAVRHAQASLLLHDRSFEAALDGFREAQRLADERGDEARGERERWHVAVTLGRLGRFDEARDLLQMGRDRAAQRWGTQAPLVGHYTFDLAVLALETGDFEQARAQLDRAESIYEVAFGSDSFRAARVRYARAKVDMANGDFGPALTSIAHALDVYERELGSDHEHMAELHEAQGVLLFFTGDLPGSIDAYRRALKIARDTLQPDNPTLGRLHSNIGESQAALDRLEEARASFAKALEIYEQSLPKNHPDLALPLKGRAQVTLKAGRAAEAVGDLERALALQLEVGREPHEIADIRFSLAQALAASDETQTSRAKELARQAGNDFERLGLPERATEVKQWLQSL
ncbi:MAG: serine/threonine-protein kinase [Myxococcota bacterium]